MSQVTRSDLSEISRVEHGPMGTHYARFKGVPNKNRCDELYEEEGPRPLRAAERLKHLGRRGEETTQVLAYSSPRPNDS